MNAGIVISFAVIIATLTVSGCLSDETIKKVDDLAYRRCKMNNMPFCLKDFCTDKDIIAIDGKYNFTLEECADACIKQICEEYAYGKEAEGG